MHNVSAIYTLPTILKTLKPPQIQGVVKARDTTSTGATAGTGASSDPTSASGLQTTFLSLLSEELQNQDPTAPVDSTAMVGQMISLNQLDQLININQTLSGASTATTATGSVQPAAGGANPSSADPLSPATSPSNTLPFDPNTMMPLASNNSSATAASLNSSLNAAMLGLSSTSTNTNTNSNNSGDK